MHCSVAGTRSRAAESGGSGFTGASAARSEQRLEFDPVTGWIVECETPSVTPVRREGVTAVSMPRATR